MNLYTYFAKFYCKYQNTSNEFFPIIIKMDSPFKYSATTKRSINAMHYS